MRRTLIVAAAAFGLVPLTGSATPISGDIAMYGQFYAVDSAWNTVTLDVATGLDFIGDTFTVDTATGDFAAAGVTTGDHGFLQDFQFSPALYPSPVNPLWSISGFQFILTSVTVISQTAQNLTLTGTGILLGSGFTQTSGDWSFHAGAKSGRFFFGSTTSAGAGVPEPAPLFLLGAGLLAVAAFRRRSRRAA